MKIMSRLILVAASLGIAGAATAIPMTGTIMGDSYVHCGATHDGCGNTLSIDAGQTFDFEIHDDRFLVSSSPVDFSLNGGAATLQMLDLFIRIDHSDPDSFRYGRLSYSLFGDNLNGNSAVEFGKFWFQNENIGNYNSIAWDGDDLTTYGWGADNRYGTRLAGNDQGLGIAFAFTTGNDFLGDGDDDDGGMGDGDDDDGGMGDGDDDDGGMDGNGDGDPGIPEPGTLFLLGIGLLGMAFRRRR